MNEKVQEFIRAQQAEIDAMNEQLRARETEAARREREQQLIQMGMCDTDDNGVRRYDILGNRICDKIAWEVSDAEYQAALAVFEEKKRLQGILTPNKEEAAHTVPKKEDEYSIRTDLAGSGSSAAGFLRILAWILWIGGLVCTLVLTVEYSFGPGFFVALFSVYAVLGALIMCNAELFQNVHTIAGSLRSFTFTRKKN